MKTTYYIEDSRGEILGYFKSLTESKRQLKKLIPNEHRIVQLKGQYFGEGFHKYYMYFDGSIFKKELT